MKKLGIAGVILLLGACSGSNGDQQFVEFVPEPLLSIARAEASLPPDVGAPLNFGIFDLAAAGYEEQEYFLSGSASAFTNLSELGSDGFWDVEPGEQADYTTRVLVRRPSNAADFNGTVLVEWMNVSSGFDTTPEWDNAHVELVREGYAWVGVTAQFVGIYGREGGIVPFHLKQVGPERYEALVHPGDSFSFDIFSQVAGALREPGAIDLLNGLQAERLIASGESQSAFRLTTYVNAVHPLYNAYDAYLIHSRGAQATPLAQDPQTAIATPPAVLVRTDLNVPVLVFQTETDVLLPSLNSLEVRQEDTDMLRFWEVTGTSHADRYGLADGSLDTGVDPSFAAVDLLDNIQGFIQCDSPVNSGPMHYVFMAGLNHLQQWVIDGTLPPSGDLLELSDDQSQFVLDEQGNVFGGIRTPYVDAPVAILSGLGQSGESFCRLFGTTQLFTASQMIDLYTDEAGYVSAVQQASDDAVAAGFLLAADAAKIVEWAPQQWAMQTSE